MTKRKLKMIHRDDLSYLLHVALRKCCDSPQTSISWNIINLMVDTENKKWSNYLDAVYTEIKRVYDYFIEKNEKMEFRNLKNAVERSSLAWKEYMGDYQSSILHCSFQLFTDEDWIGYIYAVAE